MDDRISEIREALTWDIEYVEAVRKGDPSLTFEPLEVIVAAARAYADLLDSDALIIRREDIDYEAAARRIYGNTLTLDDWDRIRAGVDAALASSQGVEHG